MKEQTNILLSIIVPVYNIADCLHYCIESIMPQLTDRTELILVDDGSSDASGAICDKFSEKSQYIKVIHKQNGGLSSARNAGIVVSRGKYIIFVDGDDYLEPDAIETMLHLVANNDADVVHYKYREVPDYKIKSHQKNILSERIRVNDEKRMFEKLYEIGGEAASACTKMFRRWIFDKIRFKEGVLHEDEYFVTELFQHINTIDYIMQFIPYNYVLRPGSIINSKYNPKQIDDQLQMQRERLELFKQSGYSDLVKTARRSLFINLLTHYYKATAAKDTKKAKALQHEARELLHTSKKDGLFPNLKGKYHIISKLIMMGIPGFYLSNLLRK